MSEKLTWKDVLRAYAVGLFPMAESREDEKLWWFDPPKRGQLDITGLHISRKLKKTILKSPYEIKIDTAFADVIDSCSEERATQSETWINRPIRNLFIDLHRAGFAHSVEAWKDGRLIGGLYGLALGGAFCGESMFSRAADASKICLVHLCARLWQAGFTVLDTQFINAHLEQFGCYEIDSETYKERLTEALRIHPDFTLLGISEKSLVLSYLKNR